MIRILTTSVKSVASAIAAIAAFCTALASPPAALAPDGWFLLQYTNVGGTEKAFGAAIAANSSDVSARHGLATIEAFEDNSAAEEDLLAVVKLAPNDPRAWCDWESLLFETRYFGFPPQLLKGLSEVGRDLPTPALRSAALSEVAQVDREDGNLGGAETIS